jgi:hypothetical protein
MSKYVRLFKNITDYREYFDEGVEIPNVSYCEDIDGMHYNPKTFYVYHTSDCTIQKVTLIDTEYFNIMSLVKDGYTYGGYFKQYLSIGTTAQSILNGEDVEFTNNIVTDEGGSPYIGDFTQTTEEQPDIISYLSEPYTENGTHMFPKNGEMYFLKEDISGYLQCYHHPGGTNRTDVLLLAFVSGVSSLNYNRAWCTIIEDDGEPTDLQMHAVQTLRISTIAGTIITLKAGTVFKSKGVQSDRGYLTYSILLNTTVSEPIVLVSAGHSYTITPKVETPDGITVVGKTRIITINELTKTGITKEDID